MPRIATVARSKMIHSGRSSDWMDTRSAGSTPRASRPWAASRTSPHVRSHVYSCQIPKSFSRMATWLGVRRAQSLAIEATVTVPSGVVAAIGSSSVAVINTSLPRSHLTGMGPVVSEARTYSEHPGTRRVGVPGPSLRCRRWLST